MISEFWRLNQEMERKAIRLQNCHAKLPYIHRLISVALNQPHQFQRIKGVYHQVVLYSDTHI